MKKTSMFNHGIKFELPSLWGWIFIAICFALSTWFQAPIFLLVGTLYFFFQSRIYRYNGVGKQLLFSLGVILALYLTSLTAYFLHSIIH